MNNQSAADLAQVPEGAMVPVNDARYPSRNIRLSAILCAIGFPIKLEEPCSRTIDVNGPRPVELVTFWHEPLLPENTYPTCPKLSATDIDAWWRYPGKFTVPGFDDALLAMRRVQEEREWILALLHGRRQLDAVRARDRGRAFAEPRAGEVATTSVHFASIMKACDIPVVAFERGRNGAKSRFVFPKAAIPIAELIAKETGHRETSETFGKDLCIDWMQWALKYGDWLLQIVNHPGCIPTIEMRDHDRVLRISSNMPEALKRQWVSYL